MQFFNVKPAIDFPPLRRPPGEPRRTPVRRVGGEASDAIRRARSKTFRDLRRIAPALHFRWRRRKDRRPEDDLTVVEGGETRVLVGFRGPGEKGGSAAREDPAAESF